MFYVIDGTGSSSQADYDRDMAGSFCKKIEKLCGAVYDRGPTLLGLGTKDIAEAQLSRLLADHARDRAAPIYLAGHSRGGAAVIHIANCLNRLRIRVRGMFLFDAVNRSPLRGVDEIPENVGACYHALRDRSLANYYEAGMKVAEEAYLACRARYLLGRECDALQKRYQELADQDIKMKRAMRCSNLFGPLVPDGGTIDFGNCGTSHRGCQIFRKEVFLGSHGAIGGAPIVDKTAPKLLIESDRAAMASVRAFMFQAMIREGAMSASLA